LKLSIVVRVHVPEPNLFPDTKAGFVTAAFFGGRYGGATEPNTNYSIPNIELPGGTKLQKTSRTLQRLDVHSLAEYVGIFQPSSGVKEDHAVFHL
jgi:hypothetical protein